MSNTSENHHAISALDWSGAEMAERQVHATLAVAYEQRTASLIAVFVAGFSTVEVSGVNYTELANQIKERLGL